MKRKIAFLTVTLFLLIGCSMSNNPTTIVENLFTKYQKVDTDIKKGINSILEEQNLTSIHKERYRDLLENQYKNLSYKIKDEHIDGDNASVIVEIEVLDYKKMINELTFDSSLYTKESFDEEKLDRLENAKDKVTYTLELFLTKNTDGKWKLAALTNEQTRKIQGMY